MPRPAPVDAWNEYAHLRDKVQWAKCDRCDWLWPEAILAKNFRDGRKICPNHSDYRESSAMRTRRIERESARLARRKEPVPKYPHAPEMRGVSGVSLITPAKTRLTVGGASKVIVLTGRNLSSADVITYPANIIEAAVPIFTAIDPDTRGNTATLTVQAIAPAGEYDLDYDDNIFKGVFEVRT